MLEKQKDEQSINEEEAVRAFMRFRSFLTEKQAFAIAFMKGMDFQRSLYEAGEPIAKEGMAH